MDIESVIAAASRAQQAVDAGLGNCSRTWHVGFFFDGIHRNIDQDASEERLSNVSRLFRAFPDEEKNTHQDSYNSLYFSGLGTPFQEDLTEKLHTIMDGAQSSALDDLKDQPKEMAKDAGLDYLKGGNWWEVLKDSGKKLISPSKWKSLAGDVAKNAAKKTGIEATPWLRDNPVIADMLVTGVDTRINSAKLRFERFFERAKTNSPVPIKLISISLFGYDVGATLVRKFIDTLLDGICQKQGDKHTYQGIPVDILFAGLFDCARHTLPVIILRRARRFLDYAHAAYLGQPQPFPEDNAPSDMYAWFIHNRQATGNDVGISQDFLVIRSLEKPDV